MLDAELVQHAHDRAAQVLAPLARARPRSRRSARRARAAARRRPARRTRPAAPRPPRAAAARPAPRRRTSPGTRPGSTAPRRARRASARIRASATPASARRRLELQRAAQVVLGARRDQRVGLGGHQRVEEARDHGGRLRAGELGLDAAVLERLHGRDALDPERGGEARVGLGVDLGQRDLAGALVDGLLEHGRELAARARTRRPRSRRPPAAAASARSTSCSKVASVASKITRSRLPSVSEFTVARAGVELSGEEAGEGVPVVLLHGLTATRRYVVMGSRALERGGHRVVELRRARPRPLVPRRRAGRLRLRGAGRRPARGARRPRDRARGAGGRLDGRAHDRPARARPWRPRRRARADHARLHARGRGLRPGALGRARATACASGGVEGFVAAYGDPQRARRLARDGHRRCCASASSAHEHPDAVADALHAVPRSRAFEDWSELARAGAADAWSSRAATRPTRAIPTRSASATRARSRAPSCCRRSRGRRRWPGRAGSSRR